MNSGTRWFANVRKLSAFVNRASKLIKLNKKAAMEPWLPSFHNRKIQLKVLFFEKHPESDTDTFHWSSNHLAVGHDRISGIGKIKFDRYFLTGK